MKERSPLSLTIVRLVMDNGERLPCLVEGRTWLPKRLAMRWAVRYRRYRVQASTLVSNLRTLGKVYSWAWERAGIDLDEYLTSGHRLEARQLESLAASLRETEIDGVRQVVSANTYNSQLSLVEDFLTWALYPANRGGHSGLSFEQLAAERTYLKVLLQSLRMRNSVSSRMEPLQAEELTAIRSTIGPQKGAKGRWQFPANGFMRQTALRNWLMVELALALGLRRGELLKLRLDSLPRGGSDGITVRRYPDDPHDSRLVEPAVKTTERVVPASRELLQAIRTYVTHPPPLGRVKGQSPYLFVTRQGQPMAIDTARDVIQRIGQWSGVSPLSWHRLRHTWAERMATILLVQPNGLDRLMYLGGWTHPSSPKRYIEQALAQQASQALREYQRQLYETTGGGDHYGLAP